MSDEKYGACGANGRHYQWMSDFEGIVRLPPEYHCDSFILPLRSFELFKMKCLILSTLLPDA